MQAECSPDFVAGLAAVVPEGVLRPVEPRYLDEPRGRYQGRAGVVACPADVAQVAMVLRACNEAGVGVIPYGGGTGLVGGQVAPGGPVPLILSLERMRAVRALDPVGNVMVAEAGCILAEVQAAAEGAGRLFPLSLASQGSARIGGLLGTNAGGTQVLRWGTMRDLCLGLEVVLADGRVIHGLSGLRKDNMGYDLRHLMIGSEGTLGVITAACLKLVAPPARVGAAMLVVRDPAAALDLLARAQARLAEGVSGFELIAGAGLRFLAQHMPQVRQPWDDAPDWSVLIDLGLPEGMDPEAELEALFTEGFEAGWVSDGVIAQSAAQRDAFWAVRESIPLANKAVGAIVSTDVSVPMAAIPEFIARADAAMAARGVRVNCFGHVGDGNLHYNLFPAEGHTSAAYDNQRADLMHAVHEIVHAMGGSVSAEHGVGRLKVADLERYGDPVAVAVMRAIKGVLDPVGILNPGAVLG